MNKTFCFAISSPVTSGLVERSPGLAAVLLNCRQLLQVAHEDLIRSHAILKTLQVHFQFRRALLRQRINHPVLVAFYVHDSAFAKIAEMFGNFYLRFAQDRLEMANAERRLRQKIQNPQPRPVAEALVNADQVHANCSRPPSRKRNKSQPRSSSCVPEPDIVSGV